MIELTRTLMLFTLLWIAVTGLGIWVAYLVLKSAIRDGIKESGLVRAMGNTTAATRRKPDHIPDFKATR